jgi:hypothetical protein
MNPNDSSNDQLPAEWIATLRSLAGERAPAELAQRVDLVRVGGVQAPPELWDHVALELGFGQTRSTRVFRWPRLVAAAAGLMVVGGFTWLALPDRPAMPNLPGWTKDGPVLAAEIPESVRQEMRARLIFMDVTPDRLSEAARVFSHLYGAPMREGG